jgi:L-threonylcarbamoyladenylate synthase
LTTAWPDVAARCAERWWPGPLTLVLPKAEHVPAVVTAGGSTVAVRVPVHPVARALIAAAERPLAAPSANPSLRISATLAEHVARGLGDRVDLILDGGPTRDGLESTVVDLSGAVPRVLRPGPISAEELSEVLKLNVARAEEQVLSHDAPLPSPGMLRKHYAPLVPLRLTDDSGAELVQQLAAAGDKVGWMPLGDAVATRAMPQIVRRPLPNEPAAYARLLYATLHELEQSGVAAIVVQRPPLGAAWSAIHDRLRRAAAE